MISAEKIVQIWKEEMPESSASYRSILGSTCVACRLQRDGEQVNRIIENDPLMYTLWIEGENVRESDLHVLTRPPKGSNLVYSSQKMRRQTIKNATEDKIRKRFRKVREWLAEQDIPHIQ